jgi:hypothetical protein
MIKKKPMYNYKFLIFLLIFSVSNNLSAQEKFEKESRIQQRDVPQQALSFLDSLQGKTKIKWYLEEGQEKKSIEAKFRLNKLSYSVEFDILGKIEDVEVEMKWNDINSTLSDALALRFKQDCLEYKVMKVQKQFTGTEQELLMMLKNGVVAAGLTLNYEIVVRCKQHNSVDLFEYLFSEQGQVLSTSKIVFKNSSHLEY